MDYSSMCVFEFELCLKFEQKLKKESFLMLNFEAVLNIIGLWAAHPIGIMKCLNDWTIPIQTPNTYQVF